MARYVGDDEFAATCADLFARGSAWVDEHLFNGQYYEQEIRPMKPEDIADKLRAEGMGARDPSSPDFQLGTACLVDQLVGQYMAHVCGLGYLLKKSNVRRALKSTKKYNFRTLTGHFNNMRSYALNDERAVLMATYPKGDRPKYPFSYFNEVMTGFEYTLAVGLMQEGAVADGLRVIESVRARYDGRRRNPFDEAECGHHYARAMASWAALTTLTGFRYSGVDRTVEFAATQKASTFFWSNGDAWGTFRQRPSKRSVAVELTVLHGRLGATQLRLAGVGAVGMKPLYKGKTFTARMLRSE
jgi:hypothetical protein